MPDGRIEPRQVDRLRAMGEWLRQYGESIYGTRGGPFPPAPWGVTTQTDNHIYLHILEWPTDIIVLPPLAQTVLEHQTLTGGDAVVEQQGSQLTITVPSADHHPIDTIVRLTVA
jgi:alpha-L-fucosidase